MNDLIQRLANAIFRQEGMGPEYRNPGNLRDAPWFPKGSLGRYYPCPADNLPETNLAYASGFWVPRSRAEGVAGAAHVIALHIAEGNSLEQLISIWAPQADGNDTKLYIQHVKEWAAIPDEKLALWNYIQDPVVS